MESQNTPVWNAVCEAQILEMTDAGMQVQIGDIKALLPKEELIDLKEPLTEQVRVYLENPKSPIASLVKARDLLEIEEATRFFESKDLVPGIVIGPIKGGYSVTLLAKSRAEAENGLGLRAFLPFSHAGLDPKLPPVLNDREPYDFKIKDFEAIKGNIIVSRRAVLQKEKREHAKNFWVTGDMGQVHSGIVKSIMPYGAFVTLDGADALLHTSDMSWESHPTEKDKVKIGQALEVIILELDKKTKKVKVGLKQLKADPWQQIENKYKVGMDITGSVVAISDFGIFVHVDDGLEGLVHTSELSWHRLKHPSQEYKIGQEVTARILSLDKTAHRISLSTKAVLGNPIEKLQEKFPVGTNIQTKIVGIKDYGLFVQLDEEVTGMVHIGELSWTQRVKDPNLLYKEGQEIEVAVMGFDTQRQRVSCSVKRLSKDPWAKWKTHYARGSRHEVSVKRVSPGGFECELEADLLAFCPTKQLGEFKPKLGEKVSVEVITCDPVQHKITISVKARTDHEAKEDYQAYMSKQDKSKSANTLLGDALKNLDVS